MSTELVKHQESSLSFNPLDTEQFVALERFAKSMALSPFVPPAFRVGPKVSIDEAVANIMLAVQVAQEMKMSWYSVLQNSDLIQGKVGWKSTYLISKINTSKKFEPLDWEFGVDGKVGKVKYNETEWSESAKRNVYIEKEFDGTDLDNITCYAFTSRVGSDRVLKSPVVDLVMAIREGWYTKAGSKWKTMRDMMFSYRTASFWSRLHYPEGTNGTLTAEEYEDISIVHDTPYEIVPTVEQEIKQKANTQVMTMEIEPDEVKDSDPKPDPKVRKSRVEPTPSVVDPTPPEPEPEQVNTETGEVTTTPPVQAATGRVRRTTSFD